MGVLKTVAIITGFDAAGNPAKISGEPANQTLHFGEQFAIAKDTSAIPPRVTVALSNEAAGALAEVPEIIEQIGELGTRITALETRPINEQAWAASVVPDFTEHRVVRISGDAATDMEIVTPIGIVDGQEYTIIVVGNEGWVATYSGTDYPGNVGIWSLLPNETSGDPDELMFTKFLCLDTGFGPGMFPLAHYFGGV